MRNLLVQIPNELADRIAAHLSSERAQAPETTKAAVVRRVLRAGLAALENLPSNSCNQLHNATHK